jgi:hypothetical protein
MEGQSTSEKLVSAEELVIKVGTKSLIGRPFGRSKYQSCFKCKFELRGIIVAEPTDEETDAGTAVIDIRVLCRSCAIAAYGGPCAELIERAVAAYSAAEVHDA